MQTYRLLALVAVALLGIVRCQPAHAAIVSFGSGGNQFNMEFVTIGSPGNAADTTGNPNPAGAVGYTYNMGKFEVSRDMITKATAAGSLGITLDDMTTFGGNGTNRPATGVSWNEAARFVNWLNTSSGGSAAYKFTTPGPNDNIALWTPADTLDYDASNPFRSLRATYWLPSVDEWYKAAYYDPNTNTYSDYPNGSNSPPTVVTGGTTANTAVYTFPNSQGPADITNAGGLSPFGIMGLGGNVQEWEETAFDLVNNVAGDTRAARGGGWFDTSLILSSSSRLGGGPASGFAGVGFRVASLSSAVVPEPVSIAIWGLMGLFGVGFAYRRWRCV